MLARVEPELQVPADRLSILDAAFISLEVSS
jgi:hypothetical protein